MLSIAPALAIAQALPGFQVPELVLCQPGSEVALGVRIIGAAEEKSAYVRVRGLPDWANPTHGHKVAVGSWAVPAADIEALRIAIPIGASGRSTIEIALIKLDGPVLAQAKTVLVVVPAAALVSHAEAGRKHPPTVLAMPATALPETAAPVEVPTRRFTAMQKLPQTSSSTPGTAGETYAEGTYLAHARPACGEPFQVSSSGSRTAGSHSSTSSRVSVMAGLAALINPAPFKSGLAPLPDQAISRSSE